MLRLEALPRIEAETDRLRGELDAERAAKVAAEKQAAVALAKLEGMTDRAKAAETATEKLEKQVTNTTQEISAMRLQAQSQGTTINSLTRECDTLRLQAKEAQTEAKKAGEEAAELRGHLLGKENKTNKNENNP